jgi:hypothetical protein
MAQREAQCTISKVRVTDSQICWPVVPNNPPTFSLHDIWMAFAVFLGLPIFSWLHMIGNVFNAPPRTFTTKATGRRVASAFVRVRQHALMSCSTCTSMQDDICLEAECVS